MSVYSGEGYGSLREAYSSGRIICNSVILCDGGSVYFDELGLLKYTGSQEFVEEGNLDEFVGAWGTEIFE